MSVVEILTQPPLSRGGAPTRLSRRPHENVPAYLDHLKSGGMQHKVLISPLEIEKR